MSYDASIVIDAGGEYLAEIEDIGNITSNVGCMYRKAMPDNYPEGGRYDGHREPEDLNGLTGLSGLRCDKAAKAMREGLVYMDENRAELLKLEPENGWGSFASARSFLTQCAQACEENPLATFAVNW